MNKLLFLNKRLLHFFLVFKSWEAGVVLTSTAVRQVLKGVFDISHSYVFVSKSNELFLTNVHCNQPNLEKNYISKNFNFKLLLKRKEILEIKRKKQQKALTIVPKKIYLKNHRIKLEIVLAQGLKKYQKKQKLIAQDHKKASKNLTKFVKI